MKVLVEIFRHDMFGRITGRQSEHYTEEHLETDRGMFDGAIQGPKVRTEANFLFALLISAEAVAQQ